METEEQQARPSIRWIRTPNDAPNGDVQDFEVPANLTRLFQRLQKDASETGCYSFVVLNEGDQYCVWRTER